MKSFQVKKTKSELILDSHSCVLFQLFVFVPKTRAFNPLPQSNMKKSNNNLTGVIQK
jgi:hypothetical protein